MKNPSSENLLSKSLIVLNQAFPWFLFILGLWLIVIKPFGGHFEFVPGDLGDARFNNYILEHFFRWISGSETSYWDAPFFFPYKNITAFSDNLLGSAIFYAGLRRVGLDRESAFQGWYLLSFVFNFPVAAYVLSRYKLHPLAVGLGAFFFTFGLPLLAQESHPQLFYRFGIPLVYYFLWQLFEQPKLSSLAALVFWLVWQFFLSIYLGFFLVLLIAIMAILTPLLDSNITISKYFQLWPRKLQQVWNQSNFRDRIVNLLIIGISLLFLVALLWPYYKTTNDYGFSRDWITVS